ncbi:hypothetical protein ES707_09338 [subsurface metagenome]
MPTLISDIPVMLPSPVSTPVTTVDRLLPPTVSSTLLRSKRPLPAIEPAVSLPSLLGPGVQKLMTALDAVLMSCALPAVELPSNSTLLLLLMVALPAVVLP